MSDFSELFTPKTDPKHLTFSAFVAKEEANLEHAVAALPAVLKPLASVAATSLGTLGAAVEAAAGSKVGTVLATELPAAEAWFASLLDKVGASSSSAAGQDAIAQVGAAVSAVMAHLTTQAVSGTLALASAVSATAVATPA